LYGEALSMALPQSNFNWSINPQLLIDKLPLMKIDGDDGFVAEVDISIFIYKFHLFFLLIIPISNSSLFT